MILNKEILCPSRIYGIIFRLRHYASLLKVMMIVNKHTLCPHQMGQYLEKTFCALANMDHFLCDTLKNIRNFF